MTNKSERHSMWHTPIRGQTFKACDREWVVEDLNHAYICVLTACVDDGDEGTGRAVACAIMIPLTIVWRQGKAQVVDYISRILQARAGTARIGE